jgi:uncharacterized membrane protein YcaP (DUF421 family)
MNDLYEWILGSWRTAAFVAVSTVLIYLSVVIALRAGERRTLAEMSTFDFAVAVAVGSIIGRVSTTASPSYIQGLVALVALLAAHRLISYGRARSVRLRRLVERRPRVLVRDGRFLAEALRREHLTEEELLGTLRQWQVRSLDDVELVVMEAKGAFSVLRRQDRPLDDRLLAGLEERRSPHQRPPQFPANTNGPSAGA